MPLPQNLEIPDDYTLPHPQFHNLFLERVVQTTGSVIVLTAGPGVGKSTYLSYLVQELRDQGKPVIRHHYSLRAGGDRPERIDSQRVAESLMADLQVELGRYLGELGIRNPMPHDLNEWLCQVSKHLVADDRQLVIVVDGLDHVWRVQGSREELRKLLDQLLPLPPGIVLVLGTQRVEDQQLPSSLLALQPKERWVELPKLDTKALREWLSHHRDLMPTNRDQDRHDWEIGQLAASLYCRTRGHPLLNRYVVERVAGEGQRLTTDSIEAIPEAPTDSVEDYYRTLWASLPEGARDIVFLLAVARFPWPDRGLFECLRIAGYEQASSLSGVGAVRHLLARDELGWSPFHGSILHFASRRPEYDSRAPALRDATIEWLETRAPDYWRRSYRWLLQLEAGDANPLLEGSNRQWAIRAISDGHPLHEVERVLQVAAWEAINQAKFPTYVDRGVLADATKWVAANEREALRWLFVAQLSLGKDDFLEPRAIAGLTELDDTDVLSLAMHLHGQGRSDKAQDCFREINRRLDRERQNLDAAEDRRRRFGIVSELAGLVAVSPDRFTAFAAQFPEEDMKQSIAESWMGGLRRSGELRYAISALCQPLSPPVQRCLSRFLAVVCADEGIHLSQDMRQLMVSPYTWVYQLFFEGQLNPALPDEPLAPESPRNYTFEEYASGVGRYAHDLFFFLVIRDLQSSGFCEQWSPPSTLRPWLRSSSKFLAQAAGDVAAGWRNSGSIVIDVIYDATMSIEHPSWNRPTDRESEDGIRKALRTITDDLLVLRRATGGSAKLSGAEMEKIASHRLAGAVELLRWIASGTTDIESEALEGLHRSLDEELPSTVESFGERAATYSLLAAVCARYGLSAKAEQYLRLASENLVAYGYHKDMLLDVALNAMEVGAPYFVSRQRLWYRLAPAIASVSEFTDGDETSHLPARLGKLLLRFDPALAKGYVKWLMDAEQYSDVEEVMKYLARTGDLTDPTVRALVSTCIGPESIRILENRASQSDTFAEQVLDLDPGFSYIRTERDTESPERTAPDGAFVGRPAPNDPDRHLKHPPSRLAKLIQSKASAGLYDLADELCAWLCSWADSEDGTDALDAVEPYFLGDERLRVTNEAVGAVKRIGGRTRSYFWLVRAQRSNNGWSQYWTNNEDTKERWSLVKCDFPDRWHTFLTESILPPPGFSPHFGMTLARLVEYLLYFGRCGDANAVASQLAETIRDLVSGQEIPTPNWIEPTSESP